MAIEKLPASPKSSKRYNLRPNPYRQRLRPSYWFPQCSHPSSMNDRSPWQPKTLVNLEDSKWASDLTNRIIPRFLRVKLPVTGVGTRNPHVLRTVCKIVRTSSREGVILWSVASSIRCTISGWLLSIVSSGGLLGISLKCCNHILRPGVRWTCWLLSWPGTYHC
jgi:hypothetical protein